MAKPAALSACCSLAAKEQECGVNLRSGRDPDKTFVSPRHGRAVSSRIRFAPYIFGRTQPAPTEGVGPPTHFAQGAGQVDGVWYLWPHSQLFVLWCYGSLGIAAHNMLWLLWLLWGPCYGLL